MSESQTASAQSVAKPEPRIPTTAGYSRSSLFEVTLFTVMVTVIATVMLVVMWEYSWLSAVFLGGAVGLLAGVVTAVLLGRPTRKKPDKPVGRAPRASAGREGRVVPAETDTPHSTLTSRATGAPADAGGVGRSPTPGARSPLDPAEIPVPGAGVPPFTAGETPRGGSAEPRVSERVAARPSGGGGGGDSAQSYDPATSRSEPIVKPATPRGGTEEIADADEPAVEPRKPGTRDAPREGGPDDLTKIRGVGPALETMLHDMGIYHFDQIASWSPAEVAWADENLEDFRGRVTRDDWVGQAKALEEG